MFGERRLANTLWKAFHRHCRWYARFRLPAATARHWKFTGFATLLPRGSPTEITVIGWLFNQFNLLSWPSFHSFFPFAVLHSLLVQVQVYGLCTHSLPSRVWCTKVRIDLCGEHLTNPEPLRLPAMIVSISLNASTLVSRTPSAALRTTQRQHRLLSIHNIVAVN